MFITLKRITDGVDTTATSVVNVRLSAIVLVESEEFRTGDDGEQLCWLQTASSRFLVVRTAELDGLVT